MANDIVISITEFLRSDMLVYDSDQEKIGTVRLHDNDAGYFMVEKGVFTHTDLYIPFQLIRTIDLNEVFLKRPKETLLQDYTQPPAITSTTSTRDGRVEETSVVANGFDNRPVVVHRVDVQGIAHQLTSDMAVYDVEGAQIGFLTQFDSARALMTVESGTFSPKVLFIPFSLIQQIYPSDNYLTLTLPKDVLKKDLSHYTAVPAN